MKSVVLSCFFLLLAQLPLAAESEETPQSLRVLFIGNSYTAWHMLPEMIAQMANANGRSLSYDMVTPGGRTFEQHWNEGKALKKIQASEWDYVVLQNQSFQPVSDPEATTKYGKLLADAAIEQGAQPMYYLTWSYANEMPWMKDKPELRDMYLTMQERLSKTYYALARETGGKVAPVGIAWEQFREANPDVRLHVRDGSHPSQIGAYLSAMVFFEALYGKAPEVAPLTLKPYKTTRDLKRWGESLSVSPEQLNDLKTAVAAAFDQKPAS